MNKVRMTKAIIIAGSVSLALATIAFADEKTEWKETKAAPDDRAASKGVEKTEQGLFPKTESYDGKWTVKGFTIVDNASGKVAFEWSDKIGAVARDYIHVSWSPDSNR